MLKSLGVLFLVFLCIPNTAYAYIDPGVTSYILQFLFAFVIGLGVLIKAFGLKIKVFLYKLTGRAEINTDDNQDTDES